MLSSRQSVCAEKHQLSYVSSRCPSWFKQIAGFLNTEVVFSEKTGRQGEGEKWWTRQKSWGVAILCHIHWTLTLSWKGVTMVQVIIYLLLLILLGAKHVCVCVLVAQSCPTLCDPMDCSPPGSSVHGILQESTEVDKRMHVGIILLEKIRVFFFVIVMQYNRK